MYIHLNEHKYTQRGKYHVLKCCACCKDFYNPVLGIALKINL